VGTEIQERWRVRLRKHVVTEQQQMTVPYRSTRAAIHPGGLPQWRRHRRHTPGPSRHWPCLVVQV
jgi:hypothetical protein